MKPPINFGPGVAPAITAIPGGWRLAIGGLPDGIVVLDLDAEGRTIVTRPFAGYGYPVLDGPWLGYKTAEADGWKARLRNLDTGQFWTFDPATGNFPLAIGHGLFVWQTGADYAIRFVTLADPYHPFTSDVGALGAPDGIAWVEPTGHVALCKDVRFSVSGMTNPARCGAAAAYTYVGEQPDLAPQWPLGISTKIIPNALNGWTLGGQECNTPKVAESVDGIAVVTYGREGVRLLLLTYAEFALLPKPPAAPSTPEPPKKPPMPTRPDRFWFGPCIGSADLVRLFDEPEKLTMGVFGLVTENILNLGTDIGPNTFEALQANHAFRKLKDAGIALAIEGASLTDLAVVEKIRAVGGEVQYFSYSEPLTIGKSVADVVAFTHAARELGVKVGLIEAWSRIKLPQQKALLEALIAADAKPAYWHLDIDRKGAVRDRLDVSAFVKDAQAIATAAGVPLGILLWGDDAATDAAYAADVWGFAQLIQAADPTLPHVCVQAWAVRKGTGRRDLPVNLGPSGLLTSFNQIVTLFTGTAPTPVPVPVPVPQPTGAVMLSTFNDPAKGVLVVKAVKPVAGTKLSTLILPTDRVFSCQPDGRAEDRPAGTEGGWERCAVSGNTATFKPDGTKYYTWPFVVVEGL